MKEIQIIEGDLLDVFDQGGVDVILHCCNCQGVMGSGIALSIKNRYPAAYSAYRKHEELWGLELGSISSCRIGEDIWNPKYIVNLHAQNFYKKSIIREDVLSDNHQTRFVDYEALYTALETFKNRYPGGVVGVPYNMAADRAGGDWVVVEAMLRSVFYEDRYKIVVVKYNK